MLSEIYYDLTYSIMLMLNFAKFYSNCSLIHNFQTIFEYFSFHSFSTIRWLSYI